MRKHHAGAVIRDFLLGAFLPENEFCTPPTQIAPPIFEIRKCATLSSHFTTTTGPGPNGTRVNATFQSFKKEGSLPNRSANFEKTLKRAGSDEAF